MTGLHAKGVAIAARAVPRATARVADAIGATLPGVTAEPVAGGVVLTGRGLTRRLADDGGLRWIGSLLR